MKQAEERCACKKKKKKLPNTNKKEWKNVKNEYNIKCIGLSWGGVVSYFSGGGNSSTLAC